MSVVASAPGKIVLAGEYAVLCGAPAICMAVDRRATATVGDSADGGCHLETPGLSDGDPFAIVESVCGGQRPALAIVLDTRAFSDERGKLGIGSSAALTVALVAALARSADVFVKAWLAHSELQQGAGSGVDVAAAVHGGLIEFRRERRRVRPLRWPEGLCVRVLSTGVPASTREKLSRLADTTEHASREVLATESGRVARAWRTGSGDAVVDCYPAYVGALRQFSVDHGLGIFDAGHDELTDAAMADGLIYKPAGAGGGDVGVLLGRSEDRLDAFVERRRDLVHGVVTCALDPQGVRVERA